jgi:hypothetical protein
MKGYIYKIFDNTNGNIYYGSTIQDVSQRIAGHRTHYKQFVNGKFGNSKSFEIIANGDYDYSIVEEVEFEKKYDLHNRERFYIENNDCVNKFIPNRTKKQYKIENRDKINEQKKQYYLENLNNIKEQHKQYYLDNCNNIKEQKKQYRLDNSDNIKEYHKQYRLDNSEKLKEYQKQYYLKKKINQTL